MTGDLGPGRTDPEDLGAVFEPYLVAAAGRAADAGDDSLATLLRDASGAEVTFADPPVTSVEGDAQVAVDVTVRVPAADGVDESTERRLADALSEVAAADGYHVRHCRVVSD